MGLINPEIIRLARYTAGGGTWAPTGAIEKVAIVPPGGGGDPSGGGGPPGGDPTGGGAPPGGGGAPPGGGPPPGMAAPGADPTGGAGGAPGGPPPGPLDPQALQQIAMAVQQAMGGAGGPGGKGKSPKDQLQASQTKIQIHLLAQIASKMGIQVDPQMLVPPSDPASDQMAMQELQSAPMMPSSDPNAGAGGGPGGAGGAPGGAPPPGGAADATGPAPIQPMDAGQGPIGGKAASFLGRLFDPDIETSLGREYDILPKIRANRQKAAAHIAIFRALSR